MIKYISLLRWINIGGNKTIKMDLLKSMYQWLWFNNVKTYIQSGNVIFETNNDNVTQLELTIKNEIGKNFWFEVEVLIRTQQELVNIIDKCPFPQDNTKILHLTLLSESPKDSDMQLVKYKKDFEEFIISWKEIYLYLPNWYWTTKLTNNFFENKLNVKATTRNWNTINKLSIL